MDAAAILLRLAAVMALVFANAFFVAAEFALVSVRRSRVEELAAHGNALARVVQKAVNDLDRYIAGTQLGITIASLGLGWVGESTLAVILLPLLQASGIAPAAETAHGIAVTFSFAFITFMHVVLGELVPKSVALQYPEKTALFVGRPMQVAVNLMRPFIWALNGAGGLVLRMVGIPEPPVHHQLHSVEELRILVDASHKGGLLDEVERDIVQRVFRFGDVLARQVMVHRTQMQCVPVDIDYEELLKLVDETPFTRLPVYEGSIDNIIGVLHLRDLYRHTRRPDAAFNLRQLIHEPLFVPETLPIESLLNEFRRNRAQMAIVLDEFGGTAGLVTLKDVLDEVVGHIYEEHEQAAEPEMVPLDDGRIALKGHVRISEVNEAFHLALEDPDADTVAGLVMNRLGRMPVAGDVVEEKGVRLRVEAVDGLRVTRLSLELPPSTPGKEEN
ncbi:MAG: hemolysin family protein [Armatimonadota bacterium]|nr:hemolysin family protein [Armatimonadota bacterium]